MLQNREFYSQSSTGQSEGGATVEDAVGIWLYVI